MIELCRYYVGNSSKPMLLKQGFGTPVALTMGTSRLAHARRGERADHTWSETATCRCANASINCSTHELTADGARGRARGTFPPPLRLPTYYIASVGPIPRVLTPRNQTILSIFCHRILLYYQFPPITRIWSNSHTFFKADQRYPTLSLHHFMAQISRRDRLLRHVYRAGQDYYRPMEEWKSRAPMRFSLLILLFSSNFLDEIWNLGHISRPQRKFISSPIPILFAFPFPRRLVDIKTLL